MIEVKIPVSNLDRPFWKWLLGSLELLFEEFMEYSDEYDFEIAEYDYDLTEEAFIVKADVKGDTESFLEELKYVIAEEAERYYELAELEYSWNFPEERVKLMRQRKIRKFVLNKIEDFYNFVKL